jgi:hypothetical protein
LYLFTRIAAHVDDDAHYKLSKLQPSTLQRVNPALGLQTAREIAFAISHIFQASQRKLPFLHSESSKKLIKRGHVYQHPSLIDHGYLKYDCKLNRLSTYQVMNFSESSSDRNLGRLFIGENFTNRRNTSIDRFNSAEWFKEIQSLVKRHYGDGQAKPSFIAGDEKHAWSLWSYRADQYMAFFKDSLGRLYSHMIDKISDIWEFVRLILVRVNIGFEVIQLLLIYRKLWML